MHTSTKAAVTAVPICSLCEQVGHLAEACGDAKGGSARLVQKAIKAFARQSKESVGAQTRFAKAIGLAAENLSRIKNGRTECSYETRQAIVSYLRTGELPTTPLDREGGRVPLPVKASTHLRYRIVYCTRVDRYALYRLGAVHPRGGAGVIAEALAAWVDKHPTPPAEGPKVARSFEFLSVVHQAELSAFDDAIGGLEQRPVWMPQAIGEWVAQPEFAKTIGPIPSDLDAAIEKAAAVPRTVAPAWNTYSNEGMLRALALCKAIAKKGETITPPALMAGLELTRNSVNQLLLGLLSTAHVERVGHGEYQLTDPQPTIPPQRLRAKRRFEEAAEEAASAKASKRPKT